MQSPHAADKVHEAIAYFASHVKYPGKVKLYKLLYYLDLMHLRRTGRTVTGLVYHAWPKGPVPELLDKEFKDPTSRLHQAFDIKDAERVYQEPHTPTIDTDESGVGAEPVAAYFKPTRVSPRFDVGQRFLTNLEFRLVKELSEIFDDATAEQMSDVSHGHAGPWRKALLAGKKQNIERPEIDMLEGAVACGRSDEELSRDELLERVRERKAVERALS